MTTKRMLLKEEGQGKMKKKNDSLVLNSDLHVMLLIFCHCQPILSIIRKHKTCITKISHLTLIFITTM